MKIVFVQPKSFHSWEALGIGYMISALKQAGHTDIDFYSGFFDSNETILRGISDADIVGFGCTSPQMKHALALASHCKGRTVFGGVHPSALPEQTVGSPYVCQAVVGEGERAITRIANGLEDTIVSAPYITDLDAIPFPDRVAIKQERNIQVAYRDNNIRIGSIFTSRGCPFSCRFCASRAVWSKRVRFRSAESVLEEFDRIVAEQHLDYVKFSDDTFTLNKKRVHDFCKQKLKSSVSLVPWGCNIRADTVDLDTLRLMQEAGCDSVWIGVESGSPSILKDMNKGETLGQIETVFNQAKQLGLRTRAYFLLGMPNETSDDIDLTEDCANRIQADDTGFTILAPYPGTEFYDIKKHRNVDWSIVDEYDNPLTSTKYLSNAELRARRDELKKRFPCRNPIQQPDVTGVE
jgi:radical SAM superfamily enzyme YgiQ (UPF0313 family)